MTMIPGLVFATRGFQIDPQAFSEARADHFGASGGVRRDAARGGGWQLDSDIYTAMRDARLRANARLINARLAKRSDSFSPDAGWYHARDLEYTLERVLEEKPLMPTALKLFPLNTEVPVGAETYRILSEESTGQARVSSSGDLGDVPLATVSGREETRNIRHVIAGHSISIWEEQADMFAGRSRRAKLLRRNRRDINFTLNKLFWGLEGLGALHGIYGVLDYPWLPRLDFEIGVSAATVQTFPQEVLAALHRLVNHPHERYQSVFYPDTLVLTNRVYNVLNQTILTPGHPQTVLKQFMETTQHIKRIEIAWELENAGGAGIDGVLAYLANEEGIELVMPQGFTSLPLIDQGLRTVSVQYASCGGVQMNYPRNNVLGLWDTNA